MLARTRLALAGVVFLAAGCIVPSNASPDVQLGLDVLSKHVHRGMTQVDKPVLKPSGSVTLPTVWDGDLAFATEAYMDLYDDTGDAWFPDGHSGRFTEIDYVADYTHTFFAIERSEDREPAPLGDLTLRVGVHNYNLPNGLEFVNGERGATSEAFVQASLSVLDATPYIRWSQDYDEVDGSYVRAGITESFDLAGDFVLTLDGSVSHSSDRMSEWNYGLLEAGIADLRGSVEIGYQVDPRTLVTLGIHGSTMVDDEFRSWFDDLGIDKDVIWVTVGAIWTFGGRR